MYLEAEEWQSPPLPCIIVLSMQTEEQRTGQAQQRGQQLREVLKLHVQVGVWSCSHFPGFDWGNYRSLKKHHPWVVDNKKVATRNETHNEGMGSHTVVVLPGKLRVVLGTRLRLPTLMLYILQVMNSCLRTIHCFFF